MKLKRWFRKWLMFLVALLIGNKIYGSKFDDGVSWRKNENKYRTNIRPQEGSHS